jgi:xanthine/CO dehydrogenase XdhC/CoxF family maturation factor
MGSRRRWQETQRQLWPTARAAEQLGPRRGPIGLELNAESPAEIVSIMAQIIMAQRGGDGRAIGAGGGYRD